MGATAPEQLEGYGLPTTELVALAVVEQVAGVVSTAELWPLTQPE